MKRESLNSAESQLNDDALLPLIDDMLHQRQAGAEKINAMFGTSISVDYASAWEDNIEELEAKQDNLEKEDASGQPETPEAADDAKEGEDNAETE